jgi:hypothetical protein
VVAGPDARLAVALLHDTVHVLPTAMFRHAAVLSSVLTGGVVQFLGTHLGKAPWKVDCPAGGLVAMRPAQGAGDRHIASTIQEDTSGRQVPVVVLYTHV